MRFLVVLCLLFLLLSLLPVGAHKCQCGTQIADPGTFPPCPDGHCFSEAGCVSATISTVSICARAIAGMHNPVCHNLANLDAMILNTTGTIDKAKDLGSVIMLTQFENMLKHGSDNNFHSGLYTSQAFIIAATSFSGFSNNGYIKVRRREVATLLARASHIKLQIWLCNAGGSPTTSDESFKISCYGPAGKAIGVDLIKNPDLVVKDPVISFETAMSFWMTPNSPKSRPRDVIIGKWNPSPADRAANRLLGYGVITNIINDGLEFGNGSNQRAQEHIGFYARYCTILETRPGENLDCTCLSETF